MADTNSESHGGIPRPRSIRDLCRLLDRQFPHINLSCHYCRVWLTVLDIYAFEQSALSLLWREGLPTGICVHCCRLLARLEFTTRHQVSCSARAVRLHTGQSLDSCEVRCLRCLARLQRIEKEFLVNQDVTVHKIGDSWRGLCVRCTVGLY